MSIEGLTFQEEGHIYRLHGIRIPSVTQAIDGVLRDFSKIPGPILEAARELGTLVHQCTALDAQNRLDEDSVDPDVMPYLKGWRKFLSDTGAAIIATEELIHHPAYSYCGALDHRLMLNGKHVLLDKKTGVPDDADAVQTSAYYEACNLRFKGPQRIQRRGALYLRDNGTYQLKWHDNRADFAVFLAALTTHRRKAGII